MKVLSLFLMFLLWLAFIPQGHVLGQWSNDPNNTYLFGYGILPQLCSDNAGGCYISYKAGGSYLGYLYLERLNKYGIKPWSSRQQIIGVEPEQADAALLPDGAGGVLVSFIDARLTGQTLSYRLRLQHYDSSGTTLWGPSGVRVSLAETNQGDQTMVSDGHGGVIIAWAEEGAVSYIQRINAQGECVWGDSGQYLYPKFDTRVVLAPDGQGGAIVAPYDSTFFRLSAQGEWLWGKEGRIVHTGASQMLFDGQENVYLFSRKILGFQNGLMLWGMVVQMIDTAGNELWGERGLSLDTVNANNVYATIFSYGGGHVWIGWCQWRARVPDLRLQCLTPAGLPLIPPARQWLTDTASEKKATVFIPQSGTGTALVVWNNISAPRGVYSQAIDTLGNRRWSTSLTVSSFDLDYTGAIGDGHDGCIVSGHVEDDFAIRIQQMSADGELGHVVTSVAEDRLPATISLSQNYPNPFNPTTTIWYELPEGMHIRLAIYDIIGRLQTVLQDEWMPPGEHPVLFNGTALPSGVYYYVLSYPSGNIVRSLTLIK